MTRDERLIHLVARSRMDVARANTRLSVEDVKQAIIWRIQTGMHPAGSRLPPVRDLAQELGTNRNTVSKAYRQLCEAGVITPVAGNRGFLVRDQGSLIAAADDLRRCAQKMIWRAMAAGVPRERIVQDLLATVASVYAARRLRLLFIECNEQDSAEMARELGALVNEPVEACVLRDAAQNARILARQNDLIITTFHHLAEVSQIFGECADRVIGVDTRPSPDTLLRIARLTGPHIGLVCTLENTTRSLRHLIKSYHPDRIVDAALADAAADVRRLARICDHVIVTHTAAEHFARITRRQPDVVVQFCVDEQSIAYLKQRIRQARLNGDTQPVATGNETTAEPV